MKSVSFRPTVATALALALLPAAVLRTRRPARRPASFRASPTPCPGSTTCSR